MAVVALSALKGAASASEFRISDVTGQGYGDVIPRLLGDDGSSRERRDFKGRVTILLFGFTHCPDLCPNSLANAAGVLDRLGEERDHVQVAFVTVDPQRDTPEALRAYVSAFGPGFVGLTGAPDAIREMAKSFRIFFQKIALPDGDYTIDHSATEYVLDQQARVRLMFAPGRAGEDVAHDVLALLHEADGAEAGGAR